MADDESPKNCLIGYTKVGKSTLFNFLNEVELKISYNNTLKRFSITAMNSLSEIGNKSQSCTTESKILGDFCDLPGISSTKTSIDKQHEEYFSIYNALKKLKKIRLILLFEIDMVYNANNSNIAIFFNKVQELYNLQSHHLSSIHLILTKAGNKKCNLIEILNHAEFESQNIIIQGIIQGKVTWNLFYKPQQCQNEYSFETQWREQILSSIKNRDFITNDAFNLESIETMLYNYAREIPKIEEEKNFWDSIGRSKDLEKYTGDVFRKRIIFLDDNVTINRVGKLRIECQVMVIRNNDSSDILKVEISEDFRLEICENMLMVNPEKAYIKIINNVTSIGFWKEANVLIKYLTYTTANYSIPVSVIMLWKDSPPCKLKLKEKKCVYIVFSYKNCEIDIDINGLLKKNNFILLDEVKKLSKNINEAQIEVLHINRKQKRLKVAETVNAKIEGFTIFTSQIPKKYKCNNFKLKAKCLIVIDSNLEINTEKVEIEAPCIVVLPKNPQNNIRFHIIGTHNTQVRFSQCIQKFKKSSLLYIKFSERNPDFSKYFPNDFQELCNRDYHYLKIEHILINSIFKEYVSMNNKYICILVYWQNDFGRVLNADQWKIQKSTTTVYSKFYILESMNFKSSIKSKYKAVKDFENITKYLDEVKIPYTDDIITKIEEVISCIPSIFQMLIIPQYYKNNQGCQELNEIKQMLIERYLDIISSSNKPKGVILKKELIKKFDRFLSKCYIHNHNDKLVKILEYLNNPVHISNHQFSKDYEDFLAIYEDLSNSIEGRNYLLDSNICGDQSSYASWTIKTGIRISACFGMNSIRIIIRELLKKGVKRAIGRIFAAGVSEAVKQTARATVNNTIKQAAKNSIKGLNTIVSFGLTATLFGVEIVANVASSIHYTGYYGEVVYLV
ncbi:hypothetical protein SteCoe_8665 [Stentor coeruleus]|uniref:G domain-containing protein n=1 Tax=Stentor coeruleus TaxID=5963 RepID=A0A1R2CJM2_9CILI|nr:hypothetical protein SteCoe_8665 [Stentor coeruleus]